MTDRIYVACLASYNNGVLHGAWIDATSDADAMQEQVDTMLRASRFPNITVDHQEHYPITCSTLARHNAGHAYYIRGTWYEDIPSAEEFAIHDHEGAALEDIGEYSSLETVAKLIEVAELAEDELGGDGEEIVAAYWDNFGGVDETLDASEIVERAREAYAGSFDSWADWAEQYADDTGLLESVPENLRYYFDFEAYGRDARCNGDLFENDGHWFYNH